MQKTFDNSFKSVINDLLKFKWLALAKLFTISIFNVLFVGLTYLSSIMINAIQNFDSYTIVLLISILVAFAVIRVINNIFNSLFENQLIKKIENHLSEKIIKKLTLNNLYSWNKVSNGEKIAFINQNLNNVAVYYHMKLFELVGNFIVIVAGLVAIGLLLPLSLSYAIPLTIILILGQIFVSKKYNKIGELIGEITQKKSNSILTTFGNFLMIKRNDFKTKYIGFYIKDQKVIFKKEVKSAKLISLIILINVGLYGLLGGLTALATISIAISHGTVQFGTIVGIITISFNVYNYGIKTINDMGALLQGRSLLKQVSTSIWFKEFEQKFVNDFETIDIKSNNQQSKQQSFSIKKGQKILIEGSNGSGKSSFLEFFSGNFWNENLVVKIDKNDFSKEKAFNMNDLSYLCTNQHYFEDLTLKENLLFGHIFGQNNTQTTQNTANLLNTLLNDFKLNHLDLNLKVEEKTMPYSEGEKQRIQIIRSILSNKQILIFDESLSNIDNETRNVIYDYLLTKEKRTVIFVSHNFDKQKYENKINQILNTNAFKVFQDKEVANA